MNDKQWLLWINELQSIAQIGKAYCDDTFCQERYARLHQLTAEIAASFTTFPQQHIADLFEKETGYLTPKLDVRGAIIQDNQILLVRERADDLWTLPGGWADINDSPSEGVVREVREESGYDVKVTKLAAVLDKRKHDHPPALPHIYKCFFMCEITGGKPQVNHEISEIAFFDKDELPPLSLPRVIPAQIHRMFEHYQNPALPADFD